MVESQEGGRKSQEIHTFNMTQVILNSLLLVCFQTYEGITPGLSEVILRVIRNILWRKKGGKRMIEIGHDFYVSYGSE